MSDRGVAKLAACVGLLLLFGCVCGCGTAKCGRPWNPSEMGAPAGAMVLAPGDELEIACLGAPELSTKQPIRRDGKVTLGLIGEYMAAGKTSEQFQKEVTELYARQLQVKETTVIVRSQAPVFVSGAVRQPGRLAISYPMSALDAIMESGGFVETDAATENVVVIRMEDGKRAGYALNLQPALRGEETPIFYLKPFDIVYVPRTRIVKVDQWVEQHINRIIPRVGVGISSSGDLFYSF